MFLATKKQLLAKSKKRLITILFLFVLMVTGCEKAPIRSDVEGYWQLKSVTYLFTGETVNYNGLYYSITYMLVKVSDPYSRYGYGQAFGRTEYSDDYNSIIIRDFMSGTGNTDTGEPAPLSTLIPYGINSQSETKFQIIHCDGKTMTLQSDYARLELKKF